LYLCCCCFFFSSRRRHTRFSRDWSSDVCSSDLDKFPIGPLVTKGLTVKSGLVHGQKYIPTLLNHIENNDIDPTYLKTHEWTLDQIGRASCRERVEIRVDAVKLNKRRIGKTNGEE